MTLQKHLMKVVGTRVLAALAVLVAILQVLDLLDVTTDILERKLGIGGVIYYATLRTPILIQQVAPLAVLAGCLFAYAQLARENAVVALRSTGMSIYRLVAITAPVAIAMVVIHLACVQWVAPRADAALDAWWAKSAPRAEQPLKTAKSFRVGTDIVTATLGDQAGRKLTDVTLYRRDAGGRLVERVQAPEADWTRTGWRLVRPQFDTLGAAKVLQGSADAMPWAEGPLPQDVRSIFTDQESLAPGSAKRALAGGVSARPATYYRTELQRSWAAPIGAIVMLLLAAPVTLVNFRSGGATTLVVCLASGLLFLVVDGVFTALGEGGNLPALLAAWAAPAIFAAVGATALVYMEG